MQHISAGSSLASHIIGGNPIRVGLVGISSYGRVHLQHLRDFERRGLARVTCAVAVNPELERTTIAELKAAGCRVVSDHHTMWAVPSADRPELCIIPTPIHLHGPMTLAALAAGASVLVEKPPAATIGQVDRMSAAAEQARRIVAVGFQYLHAPEIRALKERLLADGLGRVQEISFHGAWPRGRQYYSRNDWAGRVRLGEAWVLDSPVMNAMAHFFILLLYLAGETLGGLAILQHMEAELYRVQPIDSFDTAVLRLKTKSGIRLSFYGTHSSVAVSTPQLTINGTKGKGYWKQDSHAEIRPNYGRAWRMTAGPESVTREIMLSDVMARIRGDTTHFVSTPALVREHVRCVNALAEHVPITDIPASNILIHERDGDRFITAHGLDMFLKRAYTQRGSLSAAEAPWAVPATAVPLAGYTGLD